MYRVHDDGRIEIVRGDTARLKIIPQFYDIVDDPTEEDLPNYYEFVDGEYTKTHDTSIKEGKDYYIFTEYTMREGDTLLFTVKRNTRKILYFKRVGRKSSSNQETLKA